MVTSLTHYQHSMEFSVIRGSPRSLCAVVGDVRGHLAHIVPALPSTEAAEAAQATNYQNSQQSQSLTDKTCELSFQNKSVLFIE
jgi:hypothetical protein